MPLSNDDEISNRDLSQRNDDECKLRGGASIVTRLESYNKPGLKEADRFGDDIIDQPPAVARSRSVRQRSQRKLYDASTGKWK